MNKQGFVTVIDTEKVNPDGIFASNLRNLLLMCIKSRILEGPCGRFFVLFGSVLKTERLLFIAPELRIINSQPGIDSSLSPEGTAG